MMWRYSIYHYYALLYALIYPCATTTTVAVAFANATNARFSPPIHLFPLLLITTIPLVYRIWSDCYQVLSGQSVNGFERTKSPMENQRTSLGWKVSNKRVSCMNIASNIHYSPPMIYYLDIPLISQLLIFTDHVMITILVRQMHGSGVRNGCGGRDSSCLERFGAGQER